MQVKQMVTYRRTFIKCRKNVQDIWLKNPTRAPNYTLTGFMVTHLAIANVSLNNHVRYYVIAAKLI